MNSRILNTEVQEFLDEHLNQELDRTILKGSPFHGISIQELAEQIQSRRKCKAKLPTWYETDRIFYPPKISIEQASSERTARYKASLVSGKKLADLSGGMGVDSYFFSKSLGHVTYCEVDETLYSAARHNFEVMGASNVSCYNQESMSFLRDSKESFDWIYLDPARRGIHQERVFRLEDCTPNVPENLHLLLSRGNQLLLKLSPLMDVKMAMSQLTSVTEMQVVAVDNEVKELLIILSREPVSNPKIRAVNLKEDTTEVVGADLTTQCPEPEYGPIGTYLYEPNAAILKAGLFNELAVQYRLVKLHQNSHLYTSAELIAFPGRRFEILRQIKYQPKKMKKELGLSKANITKRNFPESVAQIRKRTGLAEGGDHYLFFTTDHRGEPIALDCLKAG